MRYSSKRQRDHRKWKLALHLLGNIKQFKKNHRCKQYNGMNSITICDSKNINTQCYIKYISLPLQYK